jgi:acyl-[acyl-carrier-protein]-phospholipid O-acyltransferase / long-chain-fatty-acid--[acyl-carrier-protein] ligase
MPGMITRKATPFDMRPTTMTLFAALRTAARREGQEKIILEDAERKTLTYRALTLGSLVMGAKLAKLSREGEAVGIMLPNTAALLLSLFGLNAFGRVAALLNFTSGVKNLRSAINTGKINTVITSKRFIDTAKLDDVIRALSNPGEGAATRIVYLEDVARTITALDKVRGLLTSIFGGPSPRTDALAADRPAAILFTSGTEGTPKGVVLSNRNLISNARQIAQHGGHFFTNTDVAMNPLPMFHSFGLTAGTLFPLLKGMKVVLYPSPLQFKQVPTLIKATNATVLFATDTFMNGYGRAADDGELASVRIAVCGAERVKDATRTQWAKWGTVLVEGYGATECSPVIACNTPDTNSKGTVGIIAPGIEAQLEPVEGITEGGKLLVRGPNIMLGYMKSDAPGIIQPPADGWHDTGDIVTLDDKGFIAIKGRAKRFAKIAGEMISLAAVETMVANVWPQSNHIVISLPDARKGEQLVLLTDKPDADKSALLAQAKVEGYPELWVPKAVLVVPQIPVLGSGKVDYPAATAMAQQTRAFL